MSLKTYAQWGFILLVSLCRLPVAHSEEKRKPIEIEHLNLTYKEKVGRGEVEQMSYHIDEDFSLSHTKLKAMVEMTGSTLSVTDGKTKFSVHKILDFINRFDSIDADDLNFHFVNSRFTGNLVRGYLGISNHHFLLNGLQAECGTINRDVMMSEDTLQFIIEVCLGKATLKLAEMTFPDQDTLFRSVFENTFGELFHSEVSLLKEAASTLIKVDHIRNLQLYLQDHLIEVAAKVKLGIDWRVSASGRIDYEPKKSRYKLELREAHVGIFGIKKIIFKALRKLNDPNVTVEEPNIYINYKAISSNKPINQFGT